MRVACFAAHSGVGKTTLIEKLIPCLTARGLRVAVIKHDAHSFEIDREGKDSWRYTRAGAEVSAIVSRDKSAVVIRRPLSLSDMLEHVGEVDVLLVEGFKGAGLPTIGLYRAASGSPLPDCRCAAVVSDCPLDTELPLLPLNDVRRVADFILSRPEFLFGG